MCTENSEFVNCNVSLLLLLHVVTVFAVIYICECEEKKKEGISLFGSCLVCCSVPNYTSIYD